MKRLLFRLAWWAAPAAVPALMVALALLAAVFSAGCAAPGRFACADLDFRTADQLRAGQAADCAPFQESAESAPAGEAKALPLPWWQALFAMISDLECRIRLVSVEWGRAEGVSQ